MNFFTYLLPSKKQREFKKKQKTQNTQKPQKTPKYFLSNKTFYTCKEQNFTCENRECPDFAKKEKKEQKEKSEKSEKGIYFCCNACLEKTVPYTVRLL
jgi:hypothetical protein